MRKLFFTIVPIIVVTLPFLTWINRINSTNRQLDQINTNTEVVHKVPSTISLFDEIAYQKALEHKGLNESLCSPVLVLKVSE